MKRTPLRRKSRLKARRSTARRVAPDRVRDDAHRAKVRALGFCISARMPGARCSGVIEASHNDYDGTKGAGLKTSDLTCIPQCSQCHRDVAQLRGPWLGWTGEMRAQWFRAATVATLVELARPFDEAMCPF